jgi:type I restriction enzyme S subunit
MKDGWQIKTLGDVCHVYQPETISQKQMTGGEFPVYGANGQIGWHNQFNHDESQLILGCRGSCGSVHFTKPRAWINGNAMVVQPKTGAIDPCYLAYALKGGIELADAITGTAQPQITRTSLMPLAITLPDSLAEQQRIVALLDETFTALATAKADAERNLQNARTLFESYLESVFSRPEGEWRETTLGAEIDLLAGFAFKSAQYTNDADGIRLLRGDNIIQGRLRWEDAKLWPSSDTEEYKRYKLLEGDVVLAMDRPWVKAGLKHADISTDDLPCLLVQRTARLRGGANLDNRFLKLLIGSAAFTRHILGAQTGIGVPHISGQQIKDFVFACPPLLEQQSIAENMESFRAETQRLTQIYERKLAVLEELKKSLLHQAFNGEL